MTAPAPPFNPILFDLPEQIETPRLLLRAPRPGDGAAVHASIAETIDDLRSFPASMLWALEEPSVAASEEFCRRGAANWLLRADFPILMFRRDSGRHVGNCGLHRFSWATRVFEIGWWCRASEQGRGYITEGAAALVEFAFGALGARRVWCSGDELNVRSWRVAERIGLRLEGTLRSERADPDGTRRDMRIYAATR